MRRYSYVTDRMNFEIYRLESGWGEIDEDWGMRNNKQRLIIRDSEERSSFIKLSGKHIRISVYVPEQYVTNESYYLGVYQCPCRVQIGANKICLMCNSLEYCLDAEVLNLMKDRMDSGWDRESLENICIIQGVSLHSLMAYADLELLDSMGVDYERV
jgi:hypothetical protein